LIHFYKRVSVSVLVPSLLVCVVSEQC